MTAELLRLLIGLVVSISALVLLNRFARLHAFFCLLVAAVLLGIITQLPFAKLIEVMQSGFGSLLAQIGLIVALGSCLGVILEKTGAMHVIAENILTAFGKKKSLLAMSVLGMLVGIPVFCDSGFIILSRLVPTIAAQTGFPASSLSLALSSGLFTTHSLVAPTPGPLAAAVNIGLAEHLGPVILVGIVGSIPVGLTGFILARKFGIRFKSTLSEFSDTSPRHHIKPWVAFLPLFTPILLISLATFSKLSSSTGVIAEILTVLGQPFFALVIGLLLSIPLVRSADKTWPAWISTALTDAGIILLITGAGGAFGNVIRQSGLEKLLEDIFEGYVVSGVVFICSAFFISAFLKTAQGSTTSSMIITTSLLAPLVSAAGFQNPVHLSSLVLAVGSGAMCVSHANDSYFWVVSQFGGIAAADALKNFTRITFFQGITGLITSIVIFLVW